ncbi:flagellar motor protein MotA [Pseudochelatococcus sp. B33]
MTLATPKLSAPRLYLIRAAVFLVLIGFLVLVLQRRIVEAFMANPGLNGLIVGVLLVGIVLALREIWQLFREVNWVNASHLTGEGLAIAPPPVLLAPMAAIFGDRLERASASALTVRALLDSLAARLDESRDIGRYLAGLLVFLGLLGTFWGLLETVSSIGNVIGTLRTDGDSSVMFDDLKTGLAAPLSGMGISFSSSLFGLAGSLVLGFLDLQTGQAQNRFYTELEDLLAHTVTDTPTLTPPAGAPVRDIAAAHAPGTAEITHALDKLSALVSENQSNRAATQALANLAEGIQSLVAHMRSEQQLIRDWVEAQAGQQEEIRRVLERLTAPPAPRID